MNNLKCIVWSPFKGVIMASMERFELPTDGLEDRYSIQLSYMEIIYGPPRSSRNFVLPL